MDIKTLIIKACIFTLEIEEISTPKSLGINFTDDKEMKLLNNKYMGYNETTDVLSFNEISMETQKKITGQKKKKYPTKKLEK